MIVSTDALTGSVPAFAVLRTLLVEETSLAEVHFGQTLIARGDFLQGLARLLASRKAVVIVLDRSLQNEIYRVESQLALTGTKYAGHRHAALALDSVFRSSTLTCWSI